MGDPEGGRGGDQLSAVPDVDRSRRAHGVEQEHSDADRRGDHKGSSTVGVDARAQFHAERSPVSNPSRNRAFGRNTSTISEGEKKGSFPPPTITQLSPSTVDPIP